jgi:hypothetical protein
MLVLYFTGGNQVLFFLEAAIQYFLLHRVYSPKMVLVLEEMSPKEYISTISSLQSSTLIINVVIVWAFQKYLKITHEEILKMKKQELQKQRFWINILSHEQRNLVQNVLGGL